MGRAPCFNVAIATYRRRDLLERTLDSLARALRPVGFERVLVVENGDSRVARAVCESIAARLPVEYEREPRSGKSRALGRALSRLEDGFVLFLDDDVRVAEGTLVAYAEAARAHGRGRIFGGPLLIDYETPPADWLRAHLPQAAAGWRPADPADPFIGTQRFLGANYGLFVEDIVAAGGFRDDIGPGSQVPGTDGNPTGQEWELQERLYLSGHRPVYVPGAEVWHYVPLERCTARWMLHRVYRHSYSRTLRSQRAGPAVATGGPGPGKAPRAVWIDLALAMARSALTRLGTDREARIRSDREIQRIRGVIAGHRTAAAGRGRRSARQGSRDARA